VAEDDDQDPLEPPIDRYPSFGPECPKAQRNHTCDRPEDHSGKHWCGWCGEYWEVSSLV
jgi:hypothetical protein